MLDQYFSQPVPKVYWWRSRAFKIGLAILVGLAVLAAVLFSDQLGNLLRLFGIKAATERTIILNGYATASGDTHYFMDGAYYTTPSGSIYVDDNDRLTLQPPISIT